MKTVPFGKLIFSHQKSLVEAVQILRENIDSRIARWAYSDELIKELEASEETDGEKIINFPQRASFETSIPAGEITLWVDDFALIIHNGIFSSETGSALGKIGVVFSPSDEFLEISKRAGFKVDRAMHQATPVHPLMAKKRASRGEKVGTLFLAAQGKSFESFVLGNGSYNLETLTTIWGIANKEFRELLDDMGLNQSQCARQFCIPLRTVQDWAVGRREPPPYIRLMMAEAVGLLSIR